MSKLFYTKLALTNINNNRKTYIPFILSSIGAIAMFYMMHFIYSNPGLAEMRGGTELRMILKLGVYVISLFSFIFLFYTNSFLMKQRKKEFGLFNILGMEKKHIAKIISLETVIVTFSSLVLGLISGAIIGQLMFMILKQILNFEIPLTANISMKSLLVTTLLFIGIFLLTLLNNLRHIHFAKPIELLKGGQVGEKEPKTRWLLTIIGVAALGYGYYIALVTESPLVAINKFFLAVFLVIIGTYALFVAGTIALLKLLRKNKKFYYQPNHFISVSGMIYRMKQNAVGLANICILSTAVLVMLSSTVSLYIGIDDLLKTRYPRDIAVTAVNISEDDTKIIEEIILDEASNYEMEVNKPIYYRYTSFPVIKEGDTFVGKEPNLQNLSHLTIIGVMTVNDYNKLENDSMTLEEDEILVYEIRGEKLGESVVISGNTFQIKKHLEKLSIDGENSANISDSYFIVVKDEQVINKLLSSEDLAMFRSNDLSFYYGFDVDGDIENEIALPNQITKRLKEASFDARIEGLEQSRDSFYSVYGGLFFLGIFLGVLFLMATVLIIYYKQISEGYDDKARFQIMKNVGLSQEEIKRSIKSQVLIVFFLPLAAAFIHIAFAFKIITKLLALLNLTNITLFVICTIVALLIFAIFYAFVYVITAREYYKIVR